MYNIVLLTTTAQKFALSMLLSGWSSIICTMWIFMDLMKLIFRWHGEISDLCHGEKSRDRKVSLKWELQPSGHLNRCQTLSHHLWAVLSVSVTSEPPQIWLGYSFTFLMIISSTTCPKIFFVLLEALLIGSDPVLTEVNKISSLVWVDFGLDPYLGAINISVEGKIPFQTSW